LNLNPNAPADAQQLAVGGYTAPTAQVKTDLVEAVHHRALSAQNQAPALAGLPSEPNRLASSSSPSHVRRSKRSDLRRRTLNQSGRYV
jgi:hypothetical protein